MGIQVRAQVASAEGPIPSPVELKTKPFCLLTCRLLAALSISLGTLWGQLCSQLIGVSCITAFCPPTRAEAPSPR